MAKKKVFVSFDFDNDRRYKYLLDAWDKNRNMDFAFDDCTSDEIQSWNIPTVKAALTRRINTCSYMLVIIGAEANKYHRDSYQIGYRNWQNFEISRAKAAGLKIVAVKLDRSYESPSELLNAGASWAMSFTQTSIIEALNRA